MMSSQKTAASMSISPEFQLQADNDQLIGKFSAAMNGKSQSGNRSSRSNSKGSWVSREEEWYFVNKRLLFATQSEEAAETWTKKLQQLVE